jgi:outer membrane biosynthesis protein TonB
MLGAVSRCWPLVALLGCAEVVVTQPMPTPSEPPSVVEHEPEAVVAASEPSEVAPERPSESGHVTRPSDPVAPPGTVPTIKASEPVVGTQDKDVIRRIVRAHVHEIRDCYNAGLAKDPTAKGMITIEFTIGPDGKVEASNVKDVTGFADPEVPTCIAEAIATWTFPEPRGGGRVIVSYPFNLVPG